MVKHRRRKELFPYDRDRLLDAMGQCRHLVDWASSEIEIGSPTYRTLDVLRKAIDDMAEVVTGDARFYWDRSSTAPRSRTDEGTA